MKTSPATGSSLSSRLVPRLDQQPPEDYNTYGRIDIQTEGRDCAMTKLTLSIDEEIVRQAKHHAVDANKTVSSLVEEGLQRVLRESRRELHTIAQMTLRAWHHFPDASPFIVLAILAFREVGFEVEAQKTGFQLRKDGRRYVVEHRRAGGKGVVRIHPYGRSAEVVAEVDVTALAARVHHVKKASEYAEIVRAVWQTAEKVKAHAQGGPLKQPTVGGGE